jgi:hypothetical protein
MIQETPERIRRRPGGSALKGGPSIRHSRVHVERIEQTLTTSLHTEGRRAAMSVGHCCPGGQMATEAARLKSKNSQKGKTKLS